MDDDATRSESRGLTGWEAGTPAPPTAEQQDEAERLLRLAEVARRRGERQAAEAHLRAALEMAPGSVDVLLAYGEHLRSKSRLAEAQETFEKALLVQPNNVVADRARAEIVLARASGLTTPAHTRRASDFEVATSGKIAVILSTMVPGLGQMVTGLPQRGAAMLGGWVLGWLVAFLVPNGMSGLFSLAGLGRSTGDFNYVVMLPVGLAASFHLWSILDASNRASKYSKKVVPRPVPPVDKDFEI